MIDKPDDVPMSNKSEEVKLALESMFPGTLEAINSGKCPMCRKPIKEFKDELSIREFKISGLCQECQDLCFT